MPTSLDDTGQAPGAARGSEPVTGLRQAREVRLNIAPGARGWFLLDAHVGAECALCPTSVRIRRRAGIEDIPVATTRDGRIADLIELPPDTSEVTWRTPARGVSDDFPYSFRRIGWFERHLRMAIRVARTFLRLPRWLREEGGISLRHILADPSATYRRATAFRVRHPLTADSADAQTGVGYPLLYYADWIRRFDQLSEADVSAIRRHIERFARHPRFHLVVCARAGKGEAAGRTLASLRSQLYDRYACTVVEAGEGGGVPPESGNDPRPPERITGPDLPSWLVDFNAALVRSEDSWLMMVEAGDVLPRHALYWLAASILAQPDATVLYSDDDVMDESGNRSAPRFKPDWSPAHFHATHYIGAAAVIRADAAARAGGITAECCEHGNYDLLLRVMADSAARCVHVPAVLLHRARHARTAGREDDAWCAAVLRRHFSRHGVAAQVEQTSPGCRRVRYGLPVESPLVTLIVPTRDAVTLLRKCLRGVLEKTAYPRYELVLVDNRSTDPEALAYLNELARHPAVRVLRYDRPFNYSAINNWAVQQARGEVLCLLNNDIEVLSPDWLEEMVGHLLQPAVGVVGAKLFYPFHRVQHGGITFGPGGCADHLHTHLFHEEPGYCNRAVVAQELSAVTGACLLTWKRAYEGLGGLNEKELPVAFNDVDYCLRAQEAGYRVIFTPHARLLHHESATRGSDAPLLRRLRARREVKYMRARWRERLRHDPYYNPNLSYWRPDFSLSETDRIERPWR